MAYVAGKVSNLISWILNFFCKDSCVSLNNKSVYAAGGGDFYETAGNRLQRLRTDTLKIKFEIQISILDACFDNINGVDIS